MLVEHVNIIGLLTNNNGVLSGFSSGNYAITAPSVFTPSTSTWEIVIGFTYVTSSSNQIILDMNDGTMSIRPITMYIDTTGKIAYGLTSSTSSYTILGESRGSHTLTNGTSYLVKLVYTGSAYTASLSSDDGITWAQDKTVSSSTPILGDYPLVLGVYQGTRAAMAGSIDLNKSYINIEGATWWSGMIDPTISKSKLVKSGSKCNVIKEVKRKYYNYVYSGWTQPTLTSNGTFWGEEFSVKPNRENDYWMPAGFGGEAYQAFDGNATTGWGTYLEHDTTHYLDMCSKTPLNITKMVLTFAGSNADSGWYHTDTRVYVSQNGDTYTQIYSKGLTTESTVELDLSSNSQYYNYYRLEIITPGGDDHDAIGLYNCAITATCRKNVEVSPVAFSESDGFYEDTLHYYVVNNNN